MGSSANGCHDALKGTPVLLIGHVLVVGSAGGKENKNNIGFTQSVNFMKCSFRGIDMHPLGGPQTNSQFLFFFLSSPVFFTPEISFKTILQLCSSAAKLYLGQGKATLPD